MPLETRLTKVDSIIKALVATKSSGNQERVSSTGDLISGLIALRGIKPSDLKKEIRRDIELALKSSKHEIKTDIWSY